MPTLIAHEAVHIALTHLLADHSEFGALALNLVYKADPKLPAMMATDGTHCFYNPARLPERTDRNHQFTLAHETGHCALGHIWRAELLRAEGFTQQQINEAADYAVNCLLIADNGVAIVGDAPQGILFDPAYRNLSMEQIARKRRADATPPPTAQPPQPQPQPDPNDAADTSDSAPDADADDSQSDADGNDAGDDADADASLPNDADADANSPSGDSSQDGDSDDSSADGTGTGSADGDPQPSDAPGAGAYDLLPPADSNADDSADAAADADAPKPMTADDWQTAVEQAFMVSRKAGTHSGDFERAIDIVRQADPSCWDTLRQFIEQTIPTDTSWNRPNRRFVAAGMYLPGSTSDTTPPLVVAIDTSGSVTQPMLDEFGAHLTAIAAEFRPRQIHVIYADTAVRHCETFEPDDEIKLRAYGGGGTCFAPTFQHVNDDADGIYADCAALIYITDLQNSDPGAVIEPDYPVLWATPSYYRDAQPFGERVWLT